MACTLRPRPLEPAPTSPQPLQKPRGWAQLVPGVLTLATLAVLVFLVFRYARIGALPGVSRTYYAAMPTARNVMRGTDVWVNGQRAGRVEAIRFAPPATDTLHRVVLEIEVLDELQPYLRRNSLAQIRTAGRLVGASVLYVVGGSTDAPALSPGDTIFAVPQGDVEAVTGQLSLAGREFTQLMEQVTLLRKSLDANSGTLGAFLGDEATLPVAGVREGAGRLVRRATDGRGTIGLATNRRSELSERARRASAAADSIRQFLASGRGELGRFRRDSTLVRTVASVRDELSIVRALAASPDGNVGRAAADSVIGLQLSRIEQEMSLLVADIKRRPLRYIAF